MEYHKQNVSMQIQMQNGSTQLFYTALLSDVSYCMKRTLHIKVFMFYIFLILKY